MKILKKIADNLQIRRFFSILVVLALILPYSALARTEAASNQPDQFYLGENGNIELNVSKDANLRERDANLQQNNQITNTANTANLPKYLPGEILVKFKPNSTVTLPRGETSASINSAYFTSSEIRTVNSKYQVTEVEKVITSTQYIPDTLSTIYSLKYASDEPIETIVEEYKKLSNDVEYAEPNYLYYTDYVPNDPLYGQQEHHQAINSAEAWEVEDGNAGTVVAVIDTGVDLNHPDLRANLVDGYDFVNLSDGDIAWLNDYGYELVEGEDYQQRDNEPSDKHGHGTHVAGIVAAVANNEIGIAGVCPNCKVIPLRNGFVIASGEYYYGTMLSQDSADAIVWAADNGADVINMSWGGYTESESITNALNYAHQRGVVLVAAAGNDNSNQPHYPSASEHVISVAANYFNILYPSLANFSNSGETIDISAPGVDILSLKASGSYMCQGDMVVNNDYCRASGTSMASPIAAGVIALVKAQYPEWDYNQIVRQIIGSTKTYIDYHLYLNYYIGHNGSGEVNSFRALTYEPRPNYTIYSAAFEELEGNGNEIVQPGEAWRFSLTLKNWWADGIRATSTLEYLDEEDFIQFDNNAVYFNGIEEGQTGVSENFFEFRVREDAPAGFQYFHIIVETPENQQVFNFDWIQMIIFDPDIPIHQPQIKDGWPKETAFTIISNATVADVNNNSNKEIIIPTGSTPGYTQREEEEEYRRNRSALRHFYIWDSQGENLEGWPKNISSSDWKTVSVADVDSDNNLEMAFFNKENYQDGSGRIYLWQQNGSDLENWPVELNEWAINIPPQIFDLDNNGDFEIITSGPAGNLNNNTYLYDANSGDLLNNSPFHPSGISSATVGNFDDDQELEFAILSNFNRDPNRNQNNNQYGAVYINNLNGSLVDGWPLELYHDDDVENIKSSILATDFNGDNRDEIVFITQANWFDRVYMINAQGEILEGWPKETANYFNQISLGDINNDGIAEIIVAECVIAHSPILHVWSANGNELRGFPLTIPLFYDYDAFLETQPIVADIDGDNYGEIIITLFNRAGYDQVVSYITAINYDGTVKADNNWPIIPGNSPQDNKNFRMLSSPVVADLDNDNSLDLVLAMASFNPDYPNQWYGGGRVYAYDLGVRDTGHHDWPQYQHDAQHSGNFGFVPAFDEEEPFNPEEAILALPNLSLVYNFRAGENQFIYPLNENLLASDVFSSIDNNLVEVINQRGNRYTPQENNIGRLIPAETYQVNVSTSTVLDLSGYVNTQPEDLPYQINLNEGDNEFIYPLEEAMAIEDVLANIMDNVVLVKNLAGDFYAPEFDYNHIGDLQPYQKYLIQTNAPVTLDFDQIGERNMAPQQLREEYNPNDLYQDYDNDNLNNAQELKLGTNPKKVDTDGDGYNDGAEVMYNTNPIIFGLVKKEPTSTTSAEQGSVRVIKKETIITPETTVKPITDTTKVTAPNSSTTSTQSANPTTTSPTPTPTPSTSNPTTATPPTTAPEPTVTKPSTSSTPSSPEPLAPITYKDNTKALIQPALNKPSTLPQCIRKLQFGSWYSYQCAG